MQTSNMKQMIVSLALLVTAALAGSLPAGAPAHLATLPLDVEMKGRRSNGHPFVLRRLSERPHAFLLSGFLSTEECETLIEAAETAGMEAAETTGGISSRQKCDIAVLSPYAINVVKAIQVDAARLLLSEETLSLPGGGCEDLHVLRYQAGGQYLPHYDANTNPRVLTALYYLNGCGSTWFPLSGTESKGAHFASHAEAKAAAAALDPASEGLLVRPAAAGDALVFFNFDDTGSPDPFALHAGTEVGVGEVKWIASHFFYAPALCEGYEVS